MFLYNVHTPSKTFALVHKGASFVPTRHYMADDKTARAKPASLIGYARKLGWTETVRQQSKRAKTRLDCCTNTRARSGLWMMVSPHPYLGKDTEVEPLMNQTTISPSSSAGSPHHRRRPLPYSSILPTPPGIRTLPLRPHLTRRLRASSSRKHKTRRRNQQ